MPERPTHYKSERIITWYDYRDAAGKLSYSVGRTAPAGPDERKQFPAISFNASGGYTWGLPKEARILYRLPELLSADPGRMVCIVEGEKDADNLAEAGLIATTSPGGAGKWDGVSTDPLKNRAIVVIGDNDEAGRRYVAAVADSLQGVARSVRVIERLPIVGEKGDVSDFLAAGGTIDMLKLLIQHAPQYQVGGEPAQETTSTRTHLVLSPVITRLSDVQREDVSWLWKPYIARGKLTILMGDPGLGKSFLSLDIAAKVTTGGSLPIDQRLDRKSVLLLTAEDGLGDTVRPRLEGLGGDPSRVTVLEAVRDASGNEMMLSLTTHQPQLEDALAVGDMSLVIIDPINAYLAGVDSYRDQSIRTVLGPLHKLADKYRVAIVCIMHLTKGRGDNPLYRGQGSIGYVGAARSVLLVGKNPHQPDQLVLAHAKSSLAQKGSSLAFQLVDGADGPVLKWQGEVDLSAEDILGQAEQQEETSALEQAKQFLITELHDGPVDAKRVMSDATSNGISSATLRRAVKDLEVKHNRVQDGQGSANGKWVWELPTRHYADDDIGPVESGDDQETDAISAAAEQGDAPEPALLAHVASNHGDMCSCGRAPAVPGRGRCFRCIQESILPAPSAEVEPGELVDF